MDYGVTVRTNGPEVIDWIDLISLWYFRNRDQMVHMHYVLSTTTVLLRQDNLTGTAPVAVMRQR